MKKKNLKIQFVELLEKYQGILHKVCYLYCNSEEDKRDTFQEIVFQMWKSFYTLKDKTKFSSWIYRIAINTAISRLRKEKRQPYKENISDLGLQIQEQETSENIKERVDYLYKAIEKLSEIEKAIIMLHLDEKSYDEISEIIGISKSNVGVKLHRIKAQLKKLLKPVYYEI